MKCMITYVSMWGLVAVGGMSFAFGSGSIYGTMSNFDVYNETEIEVHGAEIELEGIRIEDLYRTFPANFDSESIVEYQEGTTFGTRIIYQGYNFSGTGFLAPTLNPISTNGHACVASEGCEHFGFSVTGVQPTAARYYWHDQNGQRVGVMPMAVPTPSWTYLAPGNPGGEPRLRAEVEIPEPPEVIEQRPDSIWMKVFKTEIDRPVDLMELMSGNGIVPEGEGETETEWELLEGGFGKMKEAEDDVPHGKYAVIRRYEYYEYTGQYDEENEPITLFLDAGDLDDLTEPPEGELGQFISANMVAANLAAPEEGDFDQDDDVDGFDFLAWQQGFQNGVKLEDGDANWDDIIDSADLQIWTDQFSGEPEVGTMAVPEPAGGALAWFGFLLLGLGCCRYCRSR